MARLGVGPEQVTLLILALGFQNDLWSGATWRGGPGQIIDRARSLPVDAVASFAEAAGLSPDRRFVAANSLLGVDALFPGSVFQASLFDNALPVTRRLLGRAEPQVPLPNNAVTAAPAPAAPSAPSTPPPGTEGITVGQVIESAVRSESAGDWPTALRDYENLRQLDPSINVFVDAAIARVKTQLEESGRDAFRRARQYDAIGRRLDAIAWYNVVNGMAIKKFADEKIYPSGIQATLFRDQTGASLLFLWKEKGREDITLPLFQPAAKPT